MAASTTFISMVVFSELKHGRFTSFQHARSSHICLQVLQWWTCTGGPKLGADLRLCFLFLYLSYIERQIVEREASSVKRGSAADTPGGTTQNAPGLMTTGSDSILTTRDEVTLGSVLQKKIKSAEWKKKKKSLMSEIYIVQAFPPINFGSPWVFPGKFNLRVSEPFTLNSPRRRCFIRVICCPRSPLNLVRKRFFMKAIVFPWNEIMLLQIERNMEMNPKFRASEAQDRKWILFQVSNPRCFGFGNITGKGSAEKTQVYSSLES